MGGHRADSTRYAYSGGSGMSVTRQRSPNSPNSLSGSPGTVQCAFVPYWGPDNPYQDALAAALESQGIKVLNVRQLEDISGDVILGRRAIDVLHLHWLPSFESSVVSLRRLMFFTLRLCLLRKCGVRIVWTAHNLRPHECKHPRLDWLVAEIVIVLSHAIIVHSEAARRELMSTFKCVAKRKIHILPHGNYVGLYENAVDGADARRALHVPDDAVVLLFLGAIRPYKGLPELIDAFKALSATKSGVELIIAGWVLDSAYSDLIRQRIGDAQNIDYKPGFVAPSDIQLYMNACDVVVFPYREILSSGAVVLAMSFAKACIAPKLGCIQDVLDEDGAFIYDPMSEDALRDALAAALKDPDALKTMGQHNLRRAEAWSWDKIGIETKNVYLGD
jgi:beta-1,4-mannosyltransferase